MAEMTAAEVQQLIDRAKAEAFVEAAQFAQTNQPREVTIGPLFNMGWSTAMQGVSDYYLHRARELDASVPG